MESANYANNMRWILDSTPDRVYEVIATVLKGGHSDYIPTEGKGGPIDAVAAYYSSIPPGNDAAVIRNRLRVALASYFDREKPFRRDPEIAEPLLKLVKDMEATQALDRLVGLATGAEALGVSPAAEPRLRRLIIHKVLDLGPSDEDIRRIIDGNITNPQFTAICMSAAGRMRSRGSSFREYLPVAIAIWKAHPTVVQLPGVVRVFLCGMDPAYWVHFGKHFLRLNGISLDDVLQLLDEGGHDPLPKRSDSVERAFEIEIRSPLRPASPRRSTFLSNISETEHDAIRKLWARKTCVLMPAIAELAGEIREQDGKTLPAGIDIETDRYMFLPDLLGSSARQD